MITVDELLQVDTFTAHQVRSREGVDFTTAKKLLRLRRIERHLETNPEDVAVCVRAMVRMELHRERL